MKFNIAPEHTKVMGNDCTVQEIAEAFENLKSLDRNERHDFYAEIYREGWPTDAGYVLLPHLWASLRDIEDQVDLEAAYLVGLIQESIAENPGTGFHWEIVEPYSKPQCLGRTIEFLRKGTPFCNAHMPVEDCELLIMELSDYCSGADAVSPATMAKREGRDAALLKTLEEAGGLRARVDTLPQWAEVANPGSGLSHELMGELCWKTSAADSGNSSRVFWTSPEKEVTQWKSGSAHPKPES